LPILFADRVHSRSMIITSSAGVDCYCKHNRTMKLVSSDAISVELLTCFEAFSCAFSALIV
jgi:hypothetical protein